MKNFLNKIWKGIKEAFWAQIPYIIYSTVWLFLTMFWATQFFKWYVNKYIG
jgi:hypothetical protein